MDTELLKTFLEVQKTRHFGKAAENLYLTQSAVSFRVRQLEQSLGVTLFSRFRNNIQLTAAGELLLPHAQAVLTAISAAKQQLNQQYQLQTHRKVLLPAEFVVLLPPKQLTALFPPQQCWQVHTQSGAYQNVNGSDFDVVIQLGEKPLQLLPLQASCLGYLCWWPVSVNEAVNLQAECSVQQLELPRLTTSPLSFSSTDVRLLWQWLQQNKGCGYLPAPLVQAAVEQGKLHKLDATVILQPVWAYHHASDAVIEQWQQALQSCGVLQAPV
ncbi:LysR family transcriptional regulator [Rheinheimera sp. 4Y26]|uniref:LysR family transcriptional regulator n=1 Tax=Rheinheimera sp. 4Y26 TaxID=2977811 RepID=UPI0028BEA223|nr:LysR family transcriptional regulator [Rheinheimera sp. 4Y26]